MSIFVTCPFYSSKYNNIIYISFLQVTYCTKASHINTNWVKRFVFTQAFQSFLKQYLNAFATIVLHLPIGLLGHFTSSIHHRCGPGLIVQCIWLICRGSSCTTDNVKTGVLAIHQAVGVEYTWCLVWLQRLIAEYYFDNVLCIKTKEKAFIIF